MRKQGDIAAPIPRRPALSPGSRLGACMGWRSPFRIKAPVRKQGDDVGSILKRPALSPGSRLGAFILRGYESASSVAVKIRSKVVRVRVVRACTSATSRSGAG